MVEDIRRYIINTGFRKIGLTGGAGAGKSTLARALGFPTLHLDDLFIGNSQYRKELLDSKVSNFGSYVDACNQYNWWDWEAAERRIEHDSETFPQMIVEGALLGSDYLLNSYDVIFFLYVSPEERLKRLLARDSGKRDFHECLERFLITEYSETIHYNKIFTNYYEKTISLDSRGDILGYPVALPNRLPIPFRMEL